MALPPLRSARATAECESYPSVRADASTYSISIVTAKRIFEAAHYLQSENKGQAWRKPAALLIKALANVVDCGNREAKYRQLPLSNEKVRTGLWDVLAARQVRQLRGALWKCTSTLEPWCAPFFGHTPSITSHGAPKRRFTC